MNNTPLIIDTDSGMDDIIAIVMLLATNPKAILGIGTVFGLVDPKTGVRNLSRILKYLNFSIDLCIGAKSALSLRSRKDSFPKQDRINSKKLLFLQSVVPATPIIKSPNIPIEDWYIQKVSKTSKGNTILCLGPLTNIVRTINKYGDFFTKKVIRLVIMGGAYKTRGNVKPECAAEYNFFLDPKAASVVFSSTIPIQLVSLDGTIQLTFDKNKLSTNPMNPYGVIIKKIIENNQNDFQYFYDPLASGVVIDPTIATFGHPTSLAVIQIGKNRGKIIQTENKNRNIRVIRKVNTKTFYSLLNFVCNKTIVL